MLHKKGYSLASEKFDMSNVLHNMLQIKSMIKLVLSLACMFVYTYDLCASDKAMLNALVEKGVLTPAEASEIAKESVGDVEILRPTTNMLRFSGRMQVQGEWINSSAKSGVGAPEKDSNMGVIVRRIILQADASLGSGWSACVSVDLARSYVNSILTDNYIAKKIDGEYINGDLSFGYMKPGICVEDLFSSGTLMTIERSASTNYWTGAANGRRLGIGSRYAGIRWRGNVKQVEGLTYNLGISNGFNLSPYRIDELAYNFQDDSPAYWLGLHYEIKRENAKVKFGIYSMYSGSANQNMGLMDSSSAYTINPYYTGNWGNLYFWGDFLASGVADGKMVAGQYRQANPYGLNFALEYRIDIDEFGQIAPAFRYSWLDTGGRGLMVSDAQRQATNVGTLYNNAQEFYFGLNWYLSGDDVKLQLGYSYIQYSGSADDKHSGDFAESSALRMQFQVRF